MDGWTETRDLTQKMVYLFAASFVGPSLLAAITVTVVELGAVITGA